MENSTAKGKVLNKANREGFGVAFEITTDSGTLKLMAWNTDIEKNGIPMTFNVGDTLEVVYGCHNEKYNNYKVFGITPLETIDFEKIRLNAENILSRRLDYYIDRIKDKGYADFVAVILKLVGRENFEIMTAAKGHHHNYPTGLLQHTIECLDVISKFTETNMELDVDLLLASAIVHDAGKCKEYKLDYNVETGECVINSTEWADTTTHTSWINCLAVQKGLMKLARCVGAHMGKKEWGAIVEPQSKEEHLMHLADMISARSGILTKGDFIERYKLPAPKPVSPSKDEDWMPSEDEIPF